MYELMTYVNFQISGKTPTKPRLELFLSGLLGSDDYFIYQWETLFHFLNYKSKVFEAFRTWKAMVENGISLKIKRLRRDSGGKYEDTEFKQLCYEHGIKMGRTMPDIHQQNCVVKYEPNVDKKSLKHLYTIKSTKVVLGRTIRTFAYLVN